MATLLALLYLSLIGAVGYVVFSAVRRGGDCDAIEMFGTSVVVGLGVVGFILLFASFVGLGPRRPLLGAIALMAGAGALLLWRTSNLIKPRFAPEGLSRRDWFLGIPGAVAAIGFAIVTLAAVGLPLYEWDAFAIWALKAKVLYYGTLRSNPDYFHDATLAFSHADYPLLQPFLTAGLYGAMGQVDDSLGKIIFPLLHASFGCLMYSALRWKAGRAESAFLTAGAMALPVLVRWAGTGYADVPLTVFYCGSIFFLIRWLEEKRREDVILAGFLSACMASTKSEGVAIAGINMIVCLLFLLSRAERGRLRGWVMLAMIALLPLLPWLWWSREFPRSHVTSPERVLGHLGNLRFAIKAFVLEMLEPQRWSGLWLLLVLAAGLGWRGFQARHLRILWFMLMGHLALYAFVYTATTWNLDELLPVSLDRVLVHTTPVIFLLIGYHWKFVKPPIVRTTH